MKNVMFEKCREGVGMSQIQLAESLGVSKDYINMIENSRRTPGLSLAKKIADLFGTTVEDLFFTSSQNKTFVE